MQFCTIDEAWGKPTNNEHTEQQNNVKETFIPVKKNIKYSIDTDVDVLISTNLSTRLFGLFRTYS